MASSELQQAGSKRSAFDFKAVAPAPIHRAARAWLGRLAGCALAMLTVSAPGQIAPARAQSADRTRDRNRAARETPVSRVFAQASPAVVNLSTTQIVTVRDPLDEIFNMPMFAPRRYQTHSVGSGFIIHPDGFLVTNAHVVAQAAECKALFADGRELPVEEVAIDRAHDIAVMRVRAEQPLPALRLGRSDDLMPGETVVAIGNPMGLGHTVTTGIVSALNRELKFGRGVTYDGLIQIDAPINPGNSGGPLLNVLGEVVGVNSAIRGDAQNIGFAIPADRVRALLPELLDVERVRGVALGAKFEGQVGLTTLAGSTTDAAHGVRVRAVEPGSPAAKAGLAAGDVITEIDGTATHDYIDAFGVLRTAPTGRALPLRVLRDGKPRLMKLSLEPQSGIETQKVLWARFGLRLADLKADELKRLGMSRPLGLLVKDVQNGSPAARVGIAPGHVITMFGGWPVESLDKLAPLLAQVNRGDGIPFRVLQITAEGWSRDDVVVVAR
ncbi:MAG: trypsin-like peptidase domain-containing protein [Planctomycetia bacterium]|nr:MAG: trypsin-like peptidase domain-containing protein [Planctomycetia bacterium]